MERLFTPGPVEIPPKVLGVLGSQIIHHRTEEFREAFMRARALIKELLREDSDEFVFLTASGTGAMEASVVNFFRQGERVLVINAGKFGQRWVEIARYYGLEVVEYSLEWGESADLDVVFNHLKQGVSGVLFQICETSTGVYHPAPEIGRLCKDFDALCVADAITALGVYNIIPSSWGIDVLIGGSQKALLLPPGLSLVWFSKRALSRLYGGGYYFDIKRELKKQVEGQTAWTPAISLVLALEESLKLILKGGMEAVEKRHRAIALGTLRALSSYGFEPLAKSPSISVSALIYERSEELRRALLKHSIRIAGGQDRLKGKIIRISHMGVDAKDAMMLIGMIGVCLLQMGQSVDVESAVGAFIKTLREEAVW
ncbi:MAG: alanine--glyoxylate aminotransferase family protein [Aquificaceae bacterium]|nr:alanine--glyoxylate aminotransferase family protein [Aquificaceae bacterium]MDW8237855.1 alanine--glyoxylate aminotransferase family protein [Aquificaceae bacterium]